MAVGRGEASQWQLAYYPKKTKCRQNAGPLFNIKTSILLNFTSP